MALPELVVMTKQDVLAAIGEAEGAAKAADPSWPGFRLKVSRKPNAGSALAEHVAVFEGATWEHLASCEAWLEAICGFAGPRMRSSPSE